MCYDVYGSGYRHYGTSDTKFTWLLIKLQRVAGRLVTVSKIFLFSPPSLPLPHTYSHHTYVTNRMLEDFDREMEQTDSRMRSLTTRVNKAIRKSSGKDTYPFCSLLMCNRQLDISGTDQRDVLLGWGVGGSVAHPI